MNKIIMIGMNPRTRHLIPWDADAEFWTLNEGACKDWMKRWDVLFQIHPRWDWDRVNNMADPNHPLFLKGVSGLTCLYCKGTNEVFQDGKAVRCPWCDEGHYIVPDHRWTSEPFNVVREENDDLVSFSNLENGFKPKKIIMQDVNEDVPGCVRYPIQSVGTTYLTSTLAHMLVYAISFYPHVPIELYGFEAESNTEYAVQRPCIEYWIGNGRGLGMSIEAPGSHLLTGKHYGYEDFDQGYRSRLELRKRQLQEQLNAAEVASIKSEGYLQALTPFKNIKRVKPFWEAAFDDHFRKKNFVSFLRGTLKELETGIQILDAYRQDTNEATQADIRRLVELPYSL